MKACKHFSFGGKTLGASYTPQGTTFRVFSTGDDAPKLLLYPEGTGEAQVIEMVPDGDCYEVYVPGELHGRRYHYLKGGQRTTDPYSVACTVNSTHSVITDLSRTNPPGFETSGFVATPPEEAVLYELHIGDFTFNRSAGNIFGGKYLALTQEGTTCDGQTTGLDHLKALGITHVHLMPVNDFLTVDESISRFGDDDNYNWGYDPELYNVPEGSYAIRPEQPESRIMEFKRMVSALHAAGIGVVVDVVYNHTYRGSTSNLNTLAPDYYYRSRDGQWTNGSGVGNELASERSYVRKLIIDSLLYWQSEYRIDGFRFDLMALIDRETVALAAEALRAVNPNVIIYGEPWGGGDSALPDEAKTLWGSQIDRRFALFNEHFRDALRGDNDGGEWGYIQGDISRRQDVIRGLLGSIAYDEHHNGGLSHPMESVNYFNAHDNLILEDKLRKSTEDPQRLNAWTRLAFGMLLTAQGVPFFHAGNEFRRDKQGNTNSYNAPFSVNAVDWHRKAENRALCEDIAELIALRRRYGVFCLPDAQRIRETVELIDTESGDMIALKYKLNEERDLLIVHCVANEVRQLKLGGGTYPEGVRMRKVFGAQNSDETETWRMMDELTIPPLSTSIYEVEVDNNGLQREV